MHQRKNGKNYYFGIIALVGVHRNTKIIHTQHGINIVNSIAGPYKGCLIPRDSATTGGRRRLLYRH
ncbi:MAG: hypothetical protein JO249_26495 [Acidobacteria bacterium]|nr:hypothetical protein [Acidobacteriota bacterium]